MRPGAGPEPPDRPGRGPGGPPGFEKVFENELGVLWRNPAAPAHGREPGKAIVGLPLVAALAAIAALLIAIDLLLRRRPRLRACAAACGGIGAAACLVPLVLFAAGELGSPPGPPPPDPREPPPAVREEIRRKHEAVREAVQDRFERGESPDGFWPPASEDRLRGLMEEGRFRDAAALLDGALEAAGRPGVRPEEGGRRGAGGNSNG